MNDLLGWLQEWYLAQCDDDWEHQYGVTLDTLDNPGWSLTISVQGTPLEDKALERIEIERSEHDWLQCWLGEGKLRERAFCAACGPRNLQEVLVTFQRWADTT